MWFATEDGLNRYDGNTFTVFKHDDRNETSLYNNYLVSLCEDEDGSIWIAAGGALDRFDRATGKFVHYMHDPVNPLSLSEGQPNSLYKDSRGRIWIPVFGGGLDLYDRQKDCFVHYRFNPNDPHNLQSSFVTRILEDNSGRFWVGTRAGLHQFDPTTGQFQLYTHDPTDPGSISPGSSDQTLFEDSQGRLWVQTWGGDLNRLDKTRKVFSHYQVDERNPYALADNRVSSIYEDSQGTIWFGTWCGLHQYVEGENRFIRHQHDDYIPTSLSNNRVTCIMEDRSGILWIGTHRGGVNRYDRRMNRFQVRMEGQDNPRSLRVGEGVTSMLFDREGTLWVGTYGEGVFLYEKGSNAPINLRYDHSDDHSLRDNHVTCLFQLNNGNLWIGTASGSLSVYDQRKRALSHYRHNPQDSTSLAGGLISAIFEDRSGSMWVGHEGSGVDRVDPATMRVRHYRHSSLDSNSIGGDAQAFYEDHEENLWIGTGRGLDRFDRIEDRFVHCIPPRRLSRQFAYVQSIIADPDGNLWLATRYGGLYQYRIKDATFDRITQSQGLPTEYLKSMVADSHGNLWIATTAGLSRFNPTHRTFQNYRMEDGLPFEEFYARAFCKGENGQLWFGGFKGFVGFSPDSLATDSHIPPIVITSFKKFDEYVQFDTVITALKQITLSHEENFFSFEFSALDYRAPGRNQYSYKLEGFDRDWVDAGTRHYSAYTNVDPGDYVFRVKGSNSDGVWNNEGASIRIIITPPYWKTWWFRSITATLLLSVGILLYYRRVSGLEKEKRTQEEFSRKLIESQEAERKRVAADLHDGLGQDLLVVHNEVQNLMEESNDQREELQRCSKRVLESINAVREIASNLHPHHLDRLGLKAALEVMIETAAHSSSIRLNATIGEIDQLLPQKSQINLFRIAQEAISNVVRHSDASKATIEARETPSGVFIEIIDDGKGFDLGLHEASDGRRQGFGLSSMAERAKLSGGTIQILSQPGGGTTLQIRIPTEHSV